MINETVHIISCDVSFKTLRILILYLTRKNISSFFRKKTFVIHFCVFVINSQVIVIVNGFTLYSNLKLSIICRKTIMIIILYHILGGFKRIPRINMLILILN